MSTSHQPIARTFQRSFLSKPLAEQIASCDRYELARMILDLFRERSPVLEAGCGSGQWCGWLSRHSIRADGVDWSQELCERAQRELPQCHFVSCNMQSTPFQDGTYGGLLALGSIEHDPLGPAAALKEFHRVLQRGGVAVITVPYGGRLRRTVRRLGHPLFYLKTRNFVRKLFGKPVAIDIPIAAAKASTRAEWHPRFGMNEKGWYFFEYEFNKRQMRPFLLDAGFSIVREFVAFRDEGVLHTFGRLAGTWNTASGSVEFTPIGHLLRALPASVCGHMLCYVVEKR